MSTTTGEALTEREKMLRGIPYNAMVDPDLIKGRLIARKYTRLYNVSSIFSLVHPPQAGLHNLKNIIIGLSTYRIRRGDETRGFIRS